MGRDWSGPAGSCPISGSRPGPGRPLLPSFGKPSALLSKAASFVAWAGSLSMCSLVDPLVLGLADIPATKQLHELCQLPIFNKITNNDNHWIKLNYRHGQNYKLLICKTKSASYQQKHEGIPWMWKWYTQQQIVMERTYKSRFGFTPGICSCKRYTNQNCTNRTENSNLNIVFRECYGTDNLILHRVWLYQ